MRREKPVPPLNPNLNRPWATYPKAIKTAPNEQNALITSSKVLSRREIGWRAALRSRLYAHTATFNQATPQRPMATADQKGNRWAAEFGTGVMAPKLRKAKILKTAATNDMMKTDFTCFTVSAF